MEFLRCADLFSTSASRAVFHLSAKKNPQAQKILQSHLLG